MPASGRLGRRGSHGPYRLYAACTLALSGRRPAPSHPRPACHAAAKIKAHELRAKGKGDLLAQVRQPKGAGTAMGAQEAAAGGRVGGAAAGRQRLADKQQQQQQQAVFG